MLPEVRAWSHKNVSDTYQSVIDVLGYMVVDLSVISVQAVTFCDPFDGSLVLPLACGSRSEHNTGCSRPAGMWLDFQSALLDVIEIVNVASSLLVLT